MNYESFGIRSAPSLGLGDGHQQRHHRRRMTTSAPHYPLIQYWGEPHRTTQGACWVGRESLAMESRDLIVSTLLATLRQNHPGFFYDSELLQMAQALEQGFFRESSSYHDYLVKVSLKLLSLEERGAARQSSQIYDSPQSPTSCLSSLPTDSQSSSS